MTCTGAQGTHLFLLEEAGLLAREAEMRLDPINLYDYEARAKQVLPHNDWDTIDAGAMDMFTTRRNRTAFEALALRPRFVQ